MPVVGNKSQYIEKKMKKSGTPRLVPVSWPPCPPLGFPVPFGALSIPAGRVVASVVEGDVALLSSRRNRPGRPA